MFLVDIVCKLAIYRFAIYSNLSDKVGLPPYNRSLYSFVNFEKEKLLPNSLLISWAAIIALSDSLRITFVFFNLPLSNSSFVIVLLHRVLYRRGCLLYVTRTFTLFDLGSRTNLTVAPFSIIVFLVLYCKYTETLTKTLTFSRKTKKI